VHRFLPDLPGPAAEHAKMKTIGKSDRMTLRFVKRLQPLHVALEFASAAAVATPTQRFQGNVAADSASHPHCR